RLLRRRISIRPHVGSGSFTSFPPSRRVRFAPRADIRPMPAFMSARLRIDPYSTDLVGKCEQRVRYVEPHRLCGFQIEHEQEVRRLLDRQVGGFSAFEDAIDQGGRTLENLAPVRSIRHQATLANRSRKSLAAVAQRRTRITRLRLRSVSESE